MGTIKQTFNRSTVLSNLKTTFQECAFTVKNENALIRKIMKKRSKVQVKTNQRNLYFE